MYLINSFFVYSFLGFIFEQLLFIIKGTNGNSGILYGPITPIYGIGVVIIILLTNFLFKNLKLPSILEIIVVFLIVTFVLMFIEWLGGNLIEKIFGVTFWNYSDFKYNIGKYICLEVGLIWGIMSVLFIYVIKPCFDRYILFIPHWITFLLIFLFVLDVGLRLYVHFK